MINRKTNKSILAGILATFALISFCPAQAGFWGKFGRTLECLGGFSLMLASTVVHSTATVIYSTEMAKAMDSYNNCDNNSAIQRAIAYRILKKIVPVVGLIGLGFIIHSLGLHKRLGLHKLLRNKKNNGTRDNNADDGSDDNKANNINNN